MKRLIGIHLYEREGKVTALGHNLYETGEWARISIQSAEALIGGEVHLHESQQAPSFRSGRIIAYRTILDQNTLRPRRIFVFENRPEWVGRLAADTPGEWGNEQKRIYEEQEELLHS